MIQISGVTKDSRKIDELAVSGLSGVSNSLSYKVSEIEKHFHNYERWYGINPGQAGNVWAKLVSDAGMRTSFRCISGANDYGGDANDEAQIWGTSDTLSVGGVSQTKLDPMRLFVTASSITTIWYLRLVWGTGTLADALTAGQFSSFPLIADAAQGGSIDTVVNIMFPRLTIGTHKVWMQGKSATDNATLDFLIGIHGYIA